MHISGLLCDVYICEYTVEYLNIVKLEFNSCLNAGTMCSLDMTVKKPKHKRRGVDGRWQTRERD